MELNCFAKRISIVGRWLTTTLFCVLLSAFILQGAFFSNTSAMAAPVANLIATADAGDQVKGTADEVAGSSKNLIRNTEAKVKEAANSNAAKVDQADDSGSFVEGKAKRDKARIEKRAGEDADRTEKAVDKSMNAVKGLVDNIKDAFTD